MKTQTNRSQPVFTKNRVTMNYAKLQMTQRSSTWMYLTADDDSEAISQLFNKNPLNLLFSLTLKWLLMAFFWLKRNWVARVSWLKFSPHAFKLRKKKKVSIAFHIKSSRVKWSFHPSILYLFLEKPQNSLLKPRVLSLFFFIEGCRLNLARNEVIFLIWIFFFRVSGKAKAFQHSKISTDYSFHVEWQSLPQTNTKFIRKTLSASICIQREFYRCSIDKAKLNAQTLNDLSLTRFHNSMLCLIFAMCVSA